MKTNKKKFDILGKKYIAKNLMYRRKLRSSGGVLCCVMNGI